MPARPRGVLPARPPVHPFIVRLLTLTNAPPPYGPAAPRKTSLFSRRRDGPAARRRKEIGTAAKTGKQIGTDPPEKRALLFRANCMEQQLPEKHIGTAAPRTRKLLFTQTILNSSPQKKRNWDSNPQRKTAKNTSPQKKQASSHVKDMDQQLPENKLVLTQTIWASRPQKKRNWNSSPNRKTNWNRSPQKN